MPTTPLKNALYRAALPFLSPGPGRHPSLIVSGSPLVDKRGYLNLLRRHHVLGAAAILAAPGRRTLLLSSTDQPRHIAREDTLFRVASITKMATALAALRCVEEKRLGLDEPVQSCLPPACASPALEGVTLRHLLSHTSGLQDPPDLEARLIRAESVPEVLQAAANGSPGQSFRYSNLGFGLIGCILESVLQKNISAAMKEIVFDPLSLEAYMDPSSLDRDRIMPISRILPYRPGQDLQVTPLGERPLSEPDPLRHFGHTAGSMYITAPSLEKLLRCLMRDGAPLLSPSLGKEMKKVQASYGSLSPTLSYGLGLLLIQDPGLSSSRILGHQGFAYGCANGAFWEEETGRMVIFLNGGCSEARSGRLGLCNRDLLYWAFRKEMPSWSK